MGRVYKAHDEKLDRIVALKILQPAATDLLAFARFDREIRIASALEHPSIARVYEAGEWEGSRFVSMEYVDGHSLSDWSRSARRRPEAVLRVMEQIGEALSLAHRAGILHRDLKPSNVRVGSEGRAKLLDFGIAIAADPPLSGPDADTAVHLTSPGVAVGTLAYMSPEQARGQTLGVRSDIFCFGILLYEAVTGAHPFDSGKGFEAAAGVLHDDPIPDLGGRRDVPVGLPRILAKSLEKDPSRRYQHMDDLLVDLRAVRGAIEGSRGHRTRLWDRPWAWGGAGLAAGLAAALVTALHRSPEVLPPIFPAALPGARLRPIATAGLNQQPFLSRRGDRICYASDRLGSYDLFLQDVETGRVRRLTDDPADELEPSLSPDGREIAFCTRDGSLQIVPAMGGAVRTLARDATTDTVRLGSPAWSPDGQWICYRSRRQLFIVNHAGGPSRPVTTDQDPSSITGSTWSPDGGWLFYTGVQQGRFVLARVAPAGGGARVIGEDTQALGWPSFSPDGRWLVGTTAPPRTEGSSLWALPVRPDEGHVGSALRLFGAVFQHDRPSLSEDARRLAFEVRDFRLAVARVPLEAGRGLQVTERFGPGGMIIQPSVSHRGDAVAVITDRLGNLNVWRVPTAGGELDVLREGPGIDENPAWSPDDARLAFSHLIKGTFRLAVMSSTGGALALATESDVHARDPAWSPDGRQLAFIARDHAAGSLRVVPAEGGDSQLLATAPWMLSHPSWSPDGRWIAVAVLAPEGDRIAIVPSEGGPLQDVIRDARTPLWLPDGRMFSLRRNGSGAYDLQASLLPPDGAPHSNGETPFTSLPRGQSIEPDRLSSDGRFVYFGLREVARSEIWLAEAP